MFSSSLFHSKDQRLLSIFDCCENVLVCCLYHKRCTWWGYTMNKCWFSSYSSLGPHSSCVTVCSASFINWVSWNPADWSSDQHSLWSVSLVSKAPARLGRPILRAARAGPGRDPTVLKPNRALARPVKYCDRSARGLHLKLNRSMVVGTRASLATCSDQH